MILADLRVTAMRPSLEAIGRFDPNRARDRFLSSYDAADTTLIHIGETLVGFYVLRDNGDHLYIDHLYVSPLVQGGGIGRNIITGIQHQKRRIHLMALKGSKANAFYRSCGFEPVSEDTFDVNYRWDP